MGFLSRFFAPSTWGVRRRAIAAEAGGDYLTAAGLYAEIGERQKVLEMHLAHAEDAPTRPERAERLRRALRWVDDPEDRRRVQGELGRVLERMADDAAPSPGLPDRALLSEAADMLAEAGRWDEAARAYERLGDDEKAAEAFAQAGEVERMEAAYGRAEDLCGRKRKEKESFDDYQLRLSEGDRRGALAALEACIAASQTAGSYLGPRDQLLAALCRPGYVTLRIARHGAAAGEETVLVLAGGETLVLGRDPQCALCLHDVGISRRHAEVRAVGSGDGEPAFELRDLGSRNGTLLGGIPIAGSVRLLGEGEIALGERCRVGYRLAADKLELEVRRGVDQGRRLWFGPRLEPAPGLVVRFDAGQPILEAHGAVVLNGLRTARPIELITGDRISAGGIDLEVIG